MKVNKLKKNSALFLFVMLLLLQVPLLAQSNKVKVACIGNSVTYGYTLPDPAAQSYPALLQEKLGNKFDVKNFGHSGATLLKKGHTPYDKTKEFAKAIDFQPDVAIIDLGLNDTDPRGWPSYRDDFIPNYNWLIDTLRSANPDMKIYITTMTPIFTGHPRFMSSTQTWYWQVQQKIGQVAEINHTGLIDLYEAFHNRPDLFTDPPTLHPNIKGAAKLATVIYRNITGDFGGLHLSDIFTDNIVLQRNKRIPVWGMANAGTAVSVTLNYQTKTTRVAPDGQWKVFFSAMKADHNPKTLKVRNAGSKVELNDILIGDVWLCSGQSNMYFPLSKARGGKETARQAPKNQQLRLFKFEPYAQTTATTWDSAALATANNLNFFSGRWKKNNESAAAEFSAVGYYFGNKIQQKEDVPIGLIELAVGGSPQISWVSRLTLEQSPLFEPALYGWRHSDYLMRWVRQRADRNLKNAVSSYQRHPYGPAFNFEAGVAKITQYPIKGVVWYQGESDANNPELYSKLFPIFVQDWHNQWGYNFPFYYVQISSLNRPSWPYFRDAQRRLMKEVPNTGMAVTSDLGDSTNVHYPDKRPVGLRLARLALHDTYGHKQLVPHGPFVTSAVKKGHKIEVYFSQNDGLTTSDKEPLRGFRLLTDRGDSIPAAAFVEGDKVVITIPEAKAVKEIMYGWQPYTTANLVNGAGLPASTFCIILSENSS